LIDTVAAIARLNGDTDLLMVIDPGATMSIPIIVLGELYFGAESSTQIDTNVKKIDQLVSQLDILLCDEQTAQQYARIARQLRVKGRPIPQNDMWIAALAIQHGLTLLTCDAHFSEIDGLQRQSW